MLGFVVTFVIGGLSGVMFAAIPFDQQVTDTYFVVAHFHYVLFGGAVFPILAGLHYWLPKITGRLLDERLGRASFWLVFTGFNLAFFPMHITGPAGHAATGLHLSERDGLGDPQPAVLARIGGARDRPAGHRGEHSLDPPRRRRRGARPVGRRHARMVDVVATADAQLRRNPGRTQRRAQLGRASRQPRRYR